MKNNIIIFRNQLFKISESFITNQAEKLKSFTPVYVGRKLFGVPPDGATVFTMDKESIWTNLNYVLFRNTEFFEKHLHAHRPRLIHAHFGVDGVYAMNLAKKLDIPLVTTFHGFDATTTSKALLLSKKPAWINYLLHRKELAKNGDIFVCVSDFIRKKVIELGFPEKKTITHYIGIDTSIVKERHQKSEHKTILHVARLTEKKGTQYLIEAFSSVARDFPDTKLVIIGEGLLEKELKARVKGLRLAEKVLFLGALPHKEVLQWMNNSDIFCLPSITAKNGDSEGLPTVIIEASLHKLPIVSTIHSGIPEAVDNGKTGFWVPERDVEALAEKLSLLLENDTLRQDMGKAARRMVLEKFDIVKQTEKLENLYKGLL